MWQCAMLVISTVVMQSAGICRSFASSKLVCPTNLPMPGSIYLWHVVWFAPVQSANVHRQLDLKGAQGMSVNKSYLPLGEQRRTKGIEIWSIVLS